MLFGDLLFFLLLLGMRMLCGGLGGQTYLAGVLRKRWGRLDGRGGLVGGGFCFGVVTSLGVDGGGWDWGRGDWGRERGI